MIQNKKIHWTEHSRLKIKQYGLSKNKIIKLLYKPERVEKGIVEGTTALMQTNGLQNYHKKYANNFTENVKRSRGEVWLMYKDIKNERRIISCWRYPGISKPGEEIPIPKDIREELLKN